MFTIKGDGIVLGAIVAQEEIGVAARGLVG